MVFFIFLHTSKGNGLYFREHVKIAYNFDISDFLILVFIGKYKYKSKIEIFISREKLFATRRE